MCGTVDSSNVVLKMQISISRSRSRSRSDDVESSVDSGFFFSSYGGTSGCGVFFSCLMRH